MKEENKKNNKRKKINLKEIFANKQKRSIGILLLYGIFFVILIMSLNNNSNTKQTTTKRTVEKQNIAVEDINLTNYTYTYTIIKDKVTYSYSGKTYGSKQLFTFNNKEYYRSLNIYLENNDNKWTLTESPYVYLEYLDFHNLNNILGKSNLITNSIYNDGTTFNSYYMYMDGIVSKNIINLYAKNNVLKKVEISFVNGDSVVMEVSNINAVEDFDVNK